MVTLDLSWASIHAATNEFNNETFTVGISTLRKNLSVYDYIAG